MDISSLGSAYERTWHIALNLLPPSKHTTCVPPDTYLSIGVALMIDATCDTCNSL